MAISGERSRSRSLEDLKRYVANNFATEVQEPRGPIGDAASNSQTKLVEAKLEMVRAAGLFQYRADVPPVCRIDTRDRFQHAEID